MAFQDLLVAPRSDTRTVGDLTIEFIEKSHRYLLNGEKVPSVTAILGCLDKPALPWWGMQVGVRGVLQLRNLGVEVPWDDDEGVVKLLTEHKLTVNHVRNQAAGRGQTAHDALEAWARHGTPVSKAIPSPGQEGFFRALARGLEDLDLEPIDSEVMVASVKHRYAGRYDLYARQRQDGRTVRLDLKTGKAVYDVALAQIAGYEGAAVELGDDPSDRLLILRLDESGDHEIVESHVTFDMFLGIKSAYDAVAAVKASRPKKPRRTKATA